MTENERTELLRALKEEVRGTAAPATESASALKIWCEQNKTVEKDGEAPRKRHVAIDALIVLFIVFAVVAAPIIAYGAEQDTEPRIELVSDNHQVLAGATFDVYKVASCELTEDDFGTVQYDLDTLKAAAGMKKKVLGKDYTLEDYFDIANRTKSYSQGTKESIREDLNGLAGRVEAAKIAPVGEIICDGDAISVPGSGVYLFVMGGWEKLDPEDEYISTGAFVRCVVDTDEVQSVEAPLAGGYAGKQQWSDGIFGTMLHGWQDYTGALTAIYQPENAPDGAEVAVEEEPVAEEDTGDNGGDGGMVKTLLLGGATTAAVLIALKALTGRRKDGKGGSDAEPKEKESKEKTAAGASTPTDTSSGTGDDTPGTEAEKPAGEELPELGDSK